VTSIGEFAFDSCSRLAAVYYTGTEETWKAISIGSFNTPLTSANLYYYSETQPTEGDKWWHYVDGVPTVIHIYKSVTKSATCTEEGSTTYTCNGCGDSYVEKIAALGHNYQNGTCTRCDSDVYTEGLTFSLDSKTKEYSVTGYTGSSTKLVIPAKYKGYPVTSIHSFAFAKCSTFTSVTIPKSVTYIGDSAFGGCSNLTAIEVAADNTEYCSADGVLFDKKQTMLICYPAGKSGAYTIPSGVTIIVESAFYGCVGLTSVTIPSTVEKIDGGAFYGCSSLTSVIIPSAVTYIGNSAFYGCSSLTRVILNTETPLIGDDAFYGCSLEIVYYAGTEDKWNASIDDKNLRSAKIKIYYYSETMPQERDKWWHYVDGVPTVWF
jgi:hypothetical protein